jgi:hypothetical protein
MKKIAALLTIVCIATSSLFSEDDLRQYRTDSEILWLNTAGKKEGLYDAVSLSMLKWGFVLVALMGAAACSIHQSKASGTTPVK